MIKDLVIQVAILRVVDAIPHQVAPWCVAPWREGCWAPHFQEIVLSLLLAGDG